VALAEALALANLLLRLSDFETPFVLLGLFMLDTLFFLAINTASCLFLPFLSL
tara:strand:- start:92 stop:250 length:159 start_codon:yes stop_codon:yes gene_type:complete